VLSYVAGSIPTGYIIAKKLKGIDIRKEGSGNIGATNVRRVMGMKWFFIVLALDAFKGFLPVFVLSLVYKSTYPFLPVIAGLCAMLGHTFTIFLNFKGGKGVATGLGVFLALAPFSILTALVAFAIVLFVFGYISVGSMTAAVLLPFLVYIYGETGYFNLVFFFAVIAAIFVVYKHKDNIKRLIDGTESKFEYKKEQSGQ
jgi:glycerol-3-phosphate acyltransferase PlsY